MPIPADRDEPDLYCPTRIVRLALVSPATYRTGTLRRSPILVPRLEHSPATRTRVPQREPEERQPEPHIGCLGRSSATRRPEIGRLHEEVDAQTPGESWFVLDLEFPVFRFRRIERPSVEARMYERHGPGKVDECSDSKR